MQVMFGQGERPSDVGAHTLPHLDQVGPAGLCFVTSCVFGAGEFRAGSNKDLPVCSTNIDLPCTLRLSEDRKAERPWRVGRGPGH